MGFLLIADAGSRSRPLLDLHAAEDADRSVILLPCCKTHCAFRAGSSNIRFLVINSTSGKHAAHPMLFLMPARFPQAPPPQYQASHECEDLRRFFSFFSMDVGTTIEGAGGASTHLLYATTYAQRTPIMRCPPSLPPEITVVRAL